VLLSFGWGGGLGEEERACLAPPAAPVTRFPEIRATLQHLPENTCFQ
jgi:hypothetical protein